MKKCNKVEKYYVSNKHKFELLYDKSDLLYDWYISEQYTPLKLSNNLTFTINKISKKHLVFNCLFKYNDTDFNININYINEKIHNVEILSTSPTDIASHEDVFIACLNEFFKLLNY
jgi:hypothetical protein